MEEICIRWADGSTRTLTREEFTAWLAQGEMLIAWASDAVSSPENLAEAVTDRVFEKISGVFTRPPVPSLTVWQDQNVK